MLGGMAAKFCNPAALILPEGAPNTNEKLLAVNALALIFLDVLAVAATLTVIQ